MSARFEIGPYPAFLGLGPEHSSRARSRVLVLPLPYEGTASYGAGARFGPRAIIDASIEVEWYDRKLGLEPAFELGFHTLPPIFPVQSGPEEMIAAVADYARPLYRSGKFVLALGGEHTVTVGLVRAAARRWPDLCIVQVDAHADLRPEYHGTPFSHACAMRRALDELRETGQTQLVQVAVRNVSPPEHEFLRSRPRRVATFWDEDIAADAAGHWLADIEEAVRGRNVYLTVDVDGLDPAIMPATGTPEPGGLSWHQAVGLVERLAKSATIVAADVVELAPQPGNRAPDFLAAKLGYLTASRALLKQGRA